MPGLNISPGAQKSFSTATAAENEMMNTENKVRAQRRPAVKHHPEICAVAALTQHLNTQRERERHSLSLTPLGARVCYV
jgi:2-oxo-4-hydroxy-4-carboxy--5-ureidoimidazoline (OHCU) decarboxylase